MKKIIIAVFVLLLVFGMACTLSSNGNDIKSKSTDELALSGIITGNVTLNGITISRLFLEPFVDILGPPLRDYGGNDVFYDEIQIRLMWDDAGEFFNMAGSIHFGNLSLLKIDGVMMNVVTRTEVIAMLGNPLEYYEYLTYKYQSLDDGRWIRYHIADSELYVMLDIWFEHPYYEVVSSVSIRRMGW